MLRVRTAQGKDSFNIITIFHYSPMFYILEKLIHQNYSFATSSNILYDRQYGLRPKHSIIVSMTELTVNVFLLWLWKNTVRQYIWISPSMQGPWHHTPQYIITYVYDLYVLLCQMLSLRLVKELSEKYEAGSIWATVVYNIWVMDIEYGERLGSVSWPPLFMLRANGRAQYWHNCRAILLTVYLTGAKY